MAVTENWRDLSWETQWAKRMEQHWDDPMDWQRDNRSVNNLVAAMAEPRQLVWVLT